MPARLVVGAGARRARMAPATSRRGGWGLCGTSDTAHWYHSGTQGAQMTTIMIDWITALVPCFHPEPILGGRVLKLSPEGEKVWEVATRLEVAGSHETNLLIRTHGTGLNGEGVMLEISGNPTKWLQGHNLFGGFAAPGALVEALMYRLCGVLPGLQPTARNHRQWADGGIELLRVDLTQMFQLDSRGSVRAWIRAAEHSAYLKHRGRGSLTKNGTLYYGKHSRRWSLKFYSKGDELEAGKGHGLPEKRPATYENVMAGICHGLSDLLERRSDLLNYADRALRCELVMRGMELKRRGLRWCFDWSDTTGAELLNGIVQGLEMSDQLTLPATALEKLPPRLRAFYEAWVNGVDLREILPKNTFYRYRRQLLPLGVDLAIRQPHEDRSNVVPLIRVLEAVPMEPPAWAYGTPLLVGPADLIEARSRFQQRKRA